MDAETYNKKWLPRKRFAHYDGLFHRMWLEVLLDFVFAERAIASRISFGKEFLQQVKSGRARWNTKVGIAGCDVGEGGVGCQGVGRKLELGPQMQCKQRPGEREMAYHCTPACIYGCRKWGHRFKPINSTEDEDYCNTCTDLGKLCRRRTRVLLPQRFLSFELARHLLGLGFAVIVQMMMIVQKNVSWLLVGNRYV